MLVREFHLHSFGWFRTGLTLTLVLGGDIWEALADLLAHPGLVMEKPVMGM